MRSIPIDPRCRSLVVRRVQAFRQHETGVLKYVGLASEPDHLAPFEKDGEELRLGVLETDRKIIEQDLRARGGCIPCTLPNGIIAPMIVAKNGPAVLRWSSSGPYVQDRKKCEPSYFLRKKSRMGTPE